MRVSLAGGQAMKRIMLLSLVFILGGVSVAWAGKEAYKMVMSQDKELCQNVLKLFNADMKRYKAIRYDDDIFQVINWKSFTIEEPTYGCDFLSSAVFDINNDGTSDLVVKSRGCLRGELSDSFYVFPADSDVLSTLKPGPNGRAKLFETPNQFDRTGDGYKLGDAATKASEGVPQGIGGIFIIHPFIWKHTTYVSMTSFHQEWIVITKYLQGDQFQDVCYFRGKSRL
jgi:hypothetical protein